MRKCVIIILLLTFASPAYAMHISEGILPIGWATLWFAVALPFIVLGCRELKRVALDDLTMKPLVGLLAAVVFIISCMPIPVPTAGTCSHPCGTAISAVLVGPYLSVLISTVALLIQALVMAHGGLTTLGADIVSMGVVGSFTGYAAFKGLRRFGASLGSAAFCAGVLTDWATYTVTAVELASGIRGSEPFLPLFTKILIAFVPTQLPLGILEGAMTAGMVTLLARKRPDLLVRMRLMKQQEVQNA